MAGNKMSTKSKGKDDKSKPNKVVSQTNEDSGEDLDFAMLRKPILTSITGFAQARKIFDLATEELKDLLSNECDLLYECKVCRNIFRSLANFISHKRVYCKEKFNSTVHGHFIKTTSTLNEFLKIKRAEEEYQGSLKVKNGTDSLEMDKADDDRIPMSKDLTEIVERLAKAKGLERSDDQQVVLQKIPSSSVAMFQNIDFKTGRSLDNMRAQVKELDKLLSRDKAVLQSDGSFTVESSNDPGQPADAESVIQISDDEETDSGDVLKCKICDLQFSTQKTLKFHMKYKHVETRLVYPCPDCLEIFSTSWSVYRHLFKVHRKTAAQIRRLRESIQSKAFKMNNPPAFYEKRKNNMKTAPTQKITEEERLDQENQAWMDNMEGDGEVPRCGGCGRTFERRAALAAHTHTCQPRSRALAARRPDGKRIEIQIRKDYNKGPTGLAVLKADNNDNKLTNEETQPATKSNNENEKNADEDDEKDVEDEAPMDIGEDDQKSNDSGESPEKTEQNQPQIEVKPAFRLPFAIQAEKSNLAAFRQRIVRDIDFSKFMCKKCDAKHDTVLELYNHMAGHFKWMRYACKLCNFKHYNFENLPEHVKVVHKLKGDTDFYCSTVKAIDGTEAMIISRCLVEAESTFETNEADETSPESGRPSRCSSDSSRLSDDSSSSSTLKEGGSRKRKMYHNKNNAKRKKESNADDGEDQTDGQMSMDKVMKVILGDKESASSVKTFEENSSDVEDIEEKISKRSPIDDTSSVASRRPVRKRTKPKNEDFEYDLSNLLKMEAQGYRDSQSVTNSKSNQSKKKVQQDIPTSFDINKDCCGALATLSKKAVDISAAHMKTATMGVYTVQKEPRSSNIFVRPMLPKIISRGDKISPKKDITDDNTSPSKVSKTAESTLSPSKEVKSNKSSLEERPRAIQKVELKTSQKLTTKTDDLSTTEDNVDPLAIDTNHSSVNKEHNDSDSSFNKVEKESDSDLVEQIKPNRSIPSVVPLKFRRQSLELMKNPIINKNITDFTKAGMKTKILVIKPINRNKDGTRSINSSLKFQTIKLKDINKSSSTEDKPSDQVVVVKVPKVDCAIPRSASDPLGTNNEKSAPMVDANTVVNENLEKKDDENKVAQEVTEVNGEEIINDEIDEVNNSEINELETSTTVTEFVTADIVEPASTEDKSEITEET